MARPASLLVRARIDFLSTAEGGRASPVWNDYRPNHNFGEPDGRVFCMGFFRLPSSRAVSPGESAEVKILFHSLPEMLDQIVPGRRWRVQEGSRLVAHGTVLEILDNEPRPARASRTDSAGTLRMAVSLFTFVDLFSRQCATAEHLLAKGVEAGGEACLDWRLIEDMQPLRFQLMVVANFARLWPARVAGLDLPEEITDQLDTAGFKAALADARAYLAALKPEQFAGRDDVPLTVTIGNGMSPTLPSAQWLTVFATTNLYFHLSTAYGILRAKGVQIGKPDLFAGGL